MVAHQLEGSARLNMAARQLEEGNPLAPMAVRQTMANSDENFSSRYIAPERPLTNEELWVLESFLEEWEAENCPIDEEYWGLTHGGALHDEPVPALLPQPRPRRRQQQGYRESLRQFDAVALLRNQPYEPVDLQDLLDNQRFDGIKMRRGGRYIR